ncbi:MAG TPA: putative peptidoglycan glycosyltransferase FtsW [Anaerolineaceae bacterium]|nr:putative peptidoglycan glycosyltransferase FtsW [Anaerolineaceae bacterium]
MINATTPKSHRRTNVQSLSFDVGLLLIVASLLVIGLLMVYSSSWDVSMTISNSQNSIFLRQVMWVAMGVIGATVLSYFDYHHYRKLVVPMILVIIAALFVVLVVREVRYNSARSLVGGSIQPAEFAKLVSILYLSVWLTNKKDMLKDFKNYLLPLSFGIGFIVALILAQPDLSAGLTVLVLGIMLLFLAGGDWKHVGIVILVGVLGFVFLINVMPTGRIRFAQYLSGLENPTQSSYHIRRTFEAIIKGGVFGVGLGKANTKFTGLPLPHTDSIFAVLAEETGIVGAMVVIALYIFLIWRGFKIARNAPDQLGSLLAFGLTSWIVIEALINVSVIVGLLPFAGNALPFISAGGSSMTATMAAVGIVMNVARQGANKTASERSTTSATVDLRRRDWRRSVSGADRYGESE